MAIEPSLKHMHARTHKKITHKGDNAYSRDHWPRPHTIRAAQMHTHMKRRENVCWWMCTIMGGKAIVRYGPALEGPLWDEIGDSPRLR